VHDLDKLFGGLGARIAAPCRRVDDVVANMFFNHFRNESVEGSLTGHDLLKNCRTIGLRLHGTFNRLQLAADASDPGQKLPLFRFGV
jgi:hypothetical protein